MVSVNPQTSVWTTGSVSNVQAEVPDTAGNGLGGVFCQVYPTFKYSVVAPFKRINLIRTSWSETLSYAVPMMLVRGVLMCAPLAGVVTNESGASGLGI